VSTPSDPPAELPRTLPKIDFETFVISIVGSAYVHLGDAPGPDGREERNLLLARQDIDLLDVLQDKTKGNLTGDEERLLSQAITDLRLRFVEVARTK
jgi:hypothetical protein